LDVILAEHSGFCFGVEKAIQRARHELSSTEPEVHPVYSLGPVIHNRQVVESLEQIGLMTIDTADEAAGGTVIIRSHGVPEKTYHEIESQHLRLVDTTCPFVKKIQTIVRDHHQKGHSVVIIGNDTHPEVIGINGWCENQGIVVHQIADLEKVPDEATLCVVAQTTMPVALFNSIQKELSQRNQTIHWYNTICLATQDRQQAARELAQKVDAMVVIGGTHSSNTRKLAEECSRYLPDKTYLIETKTDLPLGLLSNERVVGVTAGASTPNEAIEDTIKLLQTIIPGQTWQIAIDGPAGAGKSTIAKMLADKLCFTYIDTGAMYRAFTLFALEKGCTLEETNNIIPLLDRIKMNLQKDRVYVNESDVTDAIRSQEVTEGVSIIAGIKEVRLKMVHLQREIAAKNHVVMDGRDIGTVVLPKADLKVFLTASVEERARRRFEEMKELPNVTYEGICEQIKARDYADENRKHDPLIPAKDAVQIDSTSLSINEVVDEITRLFCEKIVADHLKKM